MIGVVLDTNVVISANLNNEGLESFVVSLVLSRTFRLYVSEPVLMEYEQVLNYPRFKFLTADVDQFLSMMRQVAVLITPGPRVTAAKHEAENRFLECADAASADFLITGNKRHFPKRWKTTRIVNAREFLEHLELS